MDIKQQGGWQLAPAQTLLSARGGDPAAIGELLDGFRDYLLAVANHELDDGLRAKFAPSDLVQETFLRSQGALAGFSGATDEELRAWLAKILVNRCRDLRDAHRLTTKRGAHREVPLMPDGSAIGPVDGPAVDTLTPSGHAVVDEEVAELMSTLASLSDDCRQVVWLRNWEGLSFGEIGRRTNRTAEAARKVFNRTVQKLAEQLGSTDGSKAREAP